VFSRCIDFDMYYFCNARSANTLTHIYIYTYEFFWMDHVHVMMSQSCYASVAVA